jgi:hypothetical protein
VVEPSPTAPVEPSVAQPAWYVAFERSDILGSDPVVAPDGSHIVVGTHRFRADGTFDGLLALELNRFDAYADILALLPDGRAVAVSGTEHSLPSLIIADPDAPPAAATSRAGADEVLSVDVRADGQAIVAHQRNAVVVRQVSDLAELRSIELYEDGDNGFLNAGVAFTPDGGVAYVAPATGCTGRCAGAGVVYAASGADPAYLRDSGVVRASFSDAGDAVSISGASGVEVLALPSGDVLGRVELAVPGDPLILAVADAGRLVAVAECERLRVLELRDGVYEPVWTGPLHGDQRGCPAVNGMDFSPGGDTLAISGEVFSVLRYGVPPSPRAPPVYEVTAPDGFSAGADSIMWATPTVVGWGAAPRVLGVYTNDTDDRDFTEVRVIARDAAQIVVAGEVDAWADAVLLRFEQAARDTEDESRLSEHQEEALAYRHAYVDAAGRRTLEYAVSVRDGCEHSDRYVRVVEQDGWLVEVTLETFAGADPAAIGSYLALFLDSPFGDGSGQRLVATGVPSDC